MKTALLFAIIVLLMLIAGTMDYQDEKCAEAYSSNQTQR